MKTRKRNSGVELARFLAITFILGIHFINLVTPYTTELIERPAQTITLISFESLFIVCVDIFIVISGWFEIHASTGGLIKLMFQCLFFAIIDSIFILLIGGGEFVTLCKTLITGIFPGWFVAAYIVLYLVSPIINQFVNNAPRKRVRDLLLIMFTFLFVYGWLFNGCYGNDSTFISGFSATFLMFLYAGVRCLKVHYSEYICRQSRKFWLILFLSLFLLDILLWIVSAYFGIGAVNSKIFLYTSPIVIAQSFSMFMFFSKLDFHNKFVNWLGASSLAIMFLHRVCNGLIFKSMTLKVWNSSDGFLCIVLLMSVILGISLCAIIIDQLRIFASNIITKKLQLKHIKF